MKKPTSDTIVLFALALSNAPLTIAELSFRSGKSYNTVKSVVTGDDRVAALGDRPTRYYMAKPDVLDVDVIRLQNEAPKDGWVSWVGKVTPKMGSLIEIDKTRSLDDVHKQGLVVEALGINLVQLGRTLQKNAENPDWFTLIGGVENE